MTNVELHGEDFLVYFARHREEDCFARLCDVFKQKTYCGHDICFFG